MEVQVQSLHGHTRQHLPRSAGKSRKGNNSTYRCRTDSRSRNTWGNRTLDTHGHTFVGVAPGQTWHAGGRFICDNRIFNTSGMLMVVPWLHNCVTGDRLRFWLTNKGIECFSTLNDRFCHGLLYQQMYVYLYILFFGIYTYIQITYFLLTVMPYVFLFWVTTDAPSPTAVHVGDKRFVTSNVFVQTTNGTAWKLSFRLVFEIRCVADRLLSFCRAIQHSHRGDDACVGSTSCCF